MTETKRLSIIIETLQEVSNDGYGQKTVRNVIQQLESRLKEIRKHK